MMDCLSPPFMLEKFGEPVEKLSQLGCRGGGRGRVEEEGRGENRGRAQTTALKRCQSLYHVRPPGGRPRLAKLTTVSGRPPRGQPEAEAEERVWGRGQRARHTLLHTYAPYIHTPHTTNHTHNTYTPYIHTPHTIYTYTTPIHHTYTLHTLNLA